MLGASLTTGQLIYNNTYADTPYVPAQLPYSQSCHVGDNGKLAILMRDGYYNIHNALTGAFMYKTETMDYPWDEPGFGAYTQSSAYGLLYRLGYGATYAFDWDTGKIVWKYSAVAFSPFETPYTNINGTTVYSSYATTMIADGKVYIQNGEHTTSQPVTRGWGLHCVNATTGELLWKIMGDMNPQAVADGYLAATAPYDGHLYVFGKGKSTTTVEAPLTAVPKGTGVVIKGTVLDMSPAQPNTPCVSKDSMTTQMQYLHLQQPIDGLWHNETITGVPVSLTAIRSDGTYVDIGIVTSDGYHGTFSKSWTPPEEGDYNIVASFVGDGSYFSSSAATGLSVGPAPATPTPPEIPTPVDNTSLLYGILVAVVVAIVLALLALLAIFRKR